VGLLEKTEAGRRPVRLLGVSVHGFDERAEEPKSEPPDQLDLTIPES
jgi:hypothetical protein